MGRHRRVTVRVVAAIEVELEHEGAWTRFSTVDLSLGGVCLQCSAAPPIRQIVGLRLHLPGGVIATRGEVCWVKAAQAQIGVQFEGMAPEDLLRWARFLKESGE